MKTQSSSSKTAKHAVDAREAIDGTPPSSNAHKSGPANDEALPRKTRRDTFERDGERCTFVSKDGERCAETAGLEVDHITPRAHGGTNDLANTRVLCRWHNAYEAERILGREKMSRARRGERARELARKRAGTLSRKDVARYLDVDINANASSDNELRQSDLRTSSDHSIFDEVKLGLVKMGFRTKDVEQALVQMRSRNATCTELPRNDQMVTLVRESLALLTAC